ncbi:hypothetical protein NLX67_02045 [Domibacillus sp. A3M-37]|uniref:hypothetical protein n=1 Tax=Domibacillus sp. A3M-37 TaxID=2962037 RepID=UPI0020B6C033|nr:hypothetical protein [Domibacillus sp. A3M-37]MCP3761174.1 hypothetical protein [Domibacillus sp. A3M-37]
MDVIQIGNVTLPVVQPAVALALFGTWLYARLTLGKAFSEQVSSAAFLFIAVWKLSILLFQFELVIKAPLSLLYFNGGTNGFILGIMVALAYMGMKKMPAYKAALAWAVVVAIYPLAFALLSGSWTYWDGIQTAGSVLFFFVAKEGVERALILLLFWQLLFLSADGDVFSVEAMVYTLVTAYIIMWRKKK